MRDHEIIELYWARNESAITATAEKYGNYCHTIAYNILRNKEDAEECANDTYLGAWNSIPPQRPNRLSIYLGKITRNLALNRYKRYTAEKRGHGQVVLALSELEACVPSETTVEQTVEENELAAAIDRFLYAKPKLNRNIFVRRYYHLYAIRDIADAYGMSESKVTSLLFRMRNELRRFLEKEGIMLQHMLNNRRYMGEFSYRDVVIPDGIPAIVPQDLFDRVQEKLAKNKKAPARHKAEDDYPLTTKLFCGYCGAYLCGESGTSRTGKVHHYYKCVSVKKKRTECHKKPVRKEWIEDLVVGETMKMVMDDKAIEAIVSMLMDLQDRDNVNVPLYEQQIREADTAISNLLNAIQQGILTRSTKKRLEELENRRDELENRLACEKLAKPKVSAEFMTFWLHRFRKLDVRQQSHRKMLIDTFINAIFLYDDKMVITFNYKEGTKTITFAELQEAISNNNGSDLDCIAAPY